MKKYGFSRQDKRQLKQHGLSVTRAAEQLRRFEKGFPFVELISPCRAGEGIIQLNKKEQTAAQKKFKKEIFRKKAVKFVPASGAASRMFQFLQEAKPEYAVLKERFLRNLPDFPFYPQLSRMLKKNGQDLEQLRKEKKIEMITKALLDQGALGYGQAPKGMILFHGKGTSARTAFEEQLSEALIFKDAQKKARVHFTLPAEARTQARHHLRKGAQKLKGGQIFLSDSVQNPATDCLVADTNGEPARDKEGRLLMRPAGHGALLENLNQIKGDLIYVKNIDNILPSKKRAEADKWKRILCGVFFDVQEKVFEAQEILKQTKMTPKQAVRVLKTAQELNWKGSGRKELNAFFFRPLRVCGMVPNTGEPGGGPFWIKDKDGNLSGQIVESAEVDFKSPTQEQVWRSSTHFNPVDFVCGVYDYRKAKYNLMKYADAERGLISKKSQQGREICAMELPGLWNGGMAYWLSVFVEVPAQTFAPVKTALDLLRPEHQ